MGNRLYSTLNRVHPTGTDYKGSGQYSKVLSLNEEAKIIQHVKWRASIGCGVDWAQLQLLIQEVLVAITTSNPDRLTGYENCGQLPNMFFVRNNLSLRRTAEISKGRQVLTEADLRLWQKDAVDYLLSKPELVEALQDPPESLIKMKPLFKLDLPVKES